MPSIFFVLNSGASNAGLRCPDMKGLYDANDNASASYYWIVPVNNPQKVDLQKSLKNLIGSGYPSNNAPRMSCNISPDDSSKSICRNEVNGQLVRYNPYNGRDGAMLPNKSGNIVAVKYYGTQWIGFFQINSCKRKTRYSYTLRRLTDGYSVLPYLLLEMWTYPMRVKVVNSPDL